MDGQTLHHWAAWSSLDVLGGFFFCYEDKTTIWCGVRQSYYPFLLGPCWKCQFEVVIWKRTSSSRRVAPTSVVWEKPGDKFMMPCQFPRTKHFNCSAISLISRPSQKSTAICSAEMDPSLLLPAAACTYKRPAAHLHAAPYIASSYILSHSHYITNREWIN